LQTPLYWAIRSALATVLVGDLSSNMRTARALGRAYARIEPRRVKRTMESIRVAFPNMSEDELHRFALLAYDHLFQLGVELTHMPRVITPDTWSRHVRLGNLEPAVRELLTGRPCVMVTGHCGNWELLGHTMALIGFPMHALYRPLDLKPMDAWVRETRERRGLMLLDKFGAARAMPDLMRKGELVAFIADQNAGDRGLFVPFFNRLASTYKSIGLMALRFEAPIICGQARRLIDWRDDSQEMNPMGAVRERQVGFSSVEPHPMRYHVDVLDVILPEHWKDQPDPLFYVSARYRRALERMVEAAPEQNLWLHRYWKSRPRHEHVGRPFPKSLLEKIRALPWTTDDDIARILEWSERDTLALATTAPKPSLTKPLVESAIAK
jgi:KDO2-lipid IV(A) lauroyltransferase